MSTKKRKKKASYLPTLFRVAVLPFYSSAWELYADEVSLAVAKRILSQLVGQARRARVYDSETDTLLYEVELTRFEERYDEEHAPVPRKVRVRVTKKVRERIERVRKIKPYTKVTRKKLPAVKPKKPRKKRAKKPPKIRYRREKDSTFADVKKQTQQKIIDYVKRKRKDNRIFRFIIAVKKSVRYPKGIMSTGWYNLNGYTDKHLEQFLNRFGQIKEVVTAGQS